MATRRVSASEFQQSFGMVSDAARHQPVVVTRHGRDSLVVMAAEEWERLKRHERRAGPVEDLSDEWIEALRSARVPEEFSALDDELK